AVFQHREQLAERLAHMTGEMTAVVDDDAGRTHFTDDPAQQVRVRLVALINADALFFDELLVLDVQPDDLCVGEEVLPHAQGGTTPASARVAADSDFEQDNALVPQWLEQALVMLRIPVVAADLVAAEVLAEPAERMR